MASKSVGTMKVNLTLLTAKFNRGVKGAGADLKAFATGAIKALKTFAVAGAAAFAAVSASMVALAKQSAKTLDELGKTADRLGVATENLAGITVAARRAGIENNKLTLGLQRMTRRISEAAQGMGEAQNALKELGLDAAELNKLSPDEQFKKVAAALGEVNNQSDRIRLGFKLFDSEGVDLIRLTAEGIEDAAHFAERFGLAQSRLDIAQVEAANDAWADIGDAIKGFGNEMAIAAAGPMKNLADALLNSSHQAVNFGIGIETAIEFLKPLAASVIAGLAQIPAAFVGVNIAITEAARTAVNATIAVQKGINALPGTDRALKIAGLESAKDRLTKRLVRLSKDFTKAGGGVNTFRETYEALLKAMEMPPPDVIRPGKGGWLEQLREELDSTSGSLADFAGTTTDSLETVGDVANNALDNGFNSAVDAMTGALDRGKLEMETFSSIVLGIAQDMMNNLINNYFGQLGGFGGIFGNLFGGNSPAPGSLGPQGTGALSMTPAGVGAVGGGVSNFGGTTINIIGAKGNAEVESIVRDVVSQERADIEDTAVAKVGRLNHNNRQFLRRL